MVEVSIIIPALNEAGNIGRLVTETYAAMATAELGEIELIVVDDGSVDATAFEVKSLIDQGDFRGLRYLRHNVQSGQSAALRTGVLAAMHPVIATMDGDGQNDPHDIPHLLERLALSGVDGPVLVSGVRTKRRATGSKRWASRFANWIRDAVLRDNCPDTGCGIKVCSREVFLQLPFFTSMHRYMPALVQMCGHKVSYVSVNDRDRLAGVSKYDNLSRALIGLYDLFGVTWIRRRTKVPKVVERHPIEGQL